MKQELVSVIIPTYKRNETLERAIISVINQTYPNIEIIVVDDNAEFPKYREKNRNLLKKYKEVKLIENEKRLGGGLARNQGIKVANGDFIAFLDDDDEFLPTKIEKQYNLYKELNNNNVAMIYCYANMINIDGTKYEFKKDLEGVPLVENVKNCIAATSWWFCSKEKLEKVGGFEDISSRQDASLLLKFLLNGYEVYRVPEILLNYYWHNEENGISKVDKKSIEAEEKYKNIFLKRGELVKQKDKDEIMYFFSLRLAKMYIRLRNKKAATKELKKMIRIHKIRKENIQIIIGIIFNQTYITIANNRDKTREK